MVVKYTVNKMSIKTAFFCFLMILATCRQGVWKTGTSYKAYSAYIAYKD